MQKENFARLSPENSTAHYSIYKINKLVCRQLKYSVKYLYSTDMYQVHALLEKGRSDSDSK
jgi:hypothetical protein